MRTPAQRQTILAHLLIHHHITTTEARNDLFIMHPAGRIKDLRDRGEDIITNMVPLGDSSQADYVHLGKKEVEQ